jgi:hypothetical protein
MFDVVIFGALIMFGLFVYLLYRAAKLFVKFVAFVGIAALFPIIMVKVFNIGWTLTKDLIIQWALLGVVGFFVYYGLSILETFSKYFMDSSKTALGVDKKKRGRSVDYEE